MMKPIYFIPLCLALLLPQWSWAQPEINVQGNATSILDGANSPNTTDHSDFGAAVTCPNTASRIFTIQNTGSSNLSISGISLSGADAGYFSVSGMIFPATVGASSSATFTLTYQPYANGTANAVVNIANSDADEANYDFAVQAASINPVTVSAAVTSNYNGQDVPCFGANHGQATATASGGAGFYTYMWSSAQATATATGLVAGTYTVTVADASNCAASASVTITQPAQVSASIISQTNIACNGAATGSATAVASGGTAAYTYQWDAAASNQTTATAAGLPAGSYMVTVVDANGCQSVTTATITQPLLPLTASIISQTNVDCNGAATGSATVAVNGGTGAVFYIWSAAAGSQTPATATGLAAGTYTVTATDANGCTASATATITQPTAITLSAIPTNVTCSGGTNGSISISVIGGVSPYAFLWSNAQNTQTATNLAVGTYSVTVTDANGCTATLNATITEPTAITLSATQTNIACFGGSNGSINLTVNGGVPGYTFNWGGATTEDLSNIAAGTYTVTVTDANACTATLSRTITQPTALSVSISSQIDVFCFGGNNGQATALASGGTPAYNYQWAGGITTDVVSNLSAGSHPVTVTDMNGCSANTTATIIEPTQLSVVVLSNTPATCAGSDDGAISIMVIGGMAPYTYSWSNGMNTPAVQPLAAGIYIVTVTDMNGCTTTSTPITVTQPSSIVPNVSVNPVSCFGGNDGTATANPTGGAGGYSFAWFNAATTQTITGLIAGPGEVYVSDANGCTVIENFNILQPTQVIANAGADVSILAGNSTQLNGTVTGGTSPYIFNWTPPTGLSSTTISNPMASPAVTTDYIFSVVDAAGCADTDTVRVSIGTPPPSATLTLDMVANNGVLDTCFNVPTLVPLSYSLTCLPQYGTATLVDSCLTYTPNGMAANVVDTICIDVCDNGLCGTYTLYIPVASCVWAGDADTNLVVNNMDLLPLGLGMGETGDLRPNASTDYTCQPAFDWANSTPTDFINYKHSDTDGDGMVTNDDTMAITLNWGLTHVRSGGGGMVGDIPLYIDTAACNCSLVPGATVSFPIMLGDALNPVNDAYGFAFSINYDPTQVADGTLWMDFNTTWKGDVSTGEVIAIHKDFVGTGEVQVASTRTNGQGVTGFGKIGTLHFTIKDDILRQSSVNIEMAFANTRLITSQNVEVGTNHRPIVFVVNDSLSANVVLPVAELQLFPNPAQTAFTLQYAQGIASVVVYNALGQRILMTKPQAAQITIPINDWMEGLYFLEIETSNGLKTSRTLNKN